MPMSAKCHMTFRREQVLGKKNQHNSITNFLFGYSATCISGVFLGFVCLFVSEVDFNGEVYIFFSDPRSRTFIFINFTGELIS